MSYESAAALFLVVIPWYLLLWSSRMTPQSSTDPWKQLGLWGVMWVLRLASFWMVVFGAMLARSWAYEYGASTGVTTLFNVLVYVVIPLGASATMVLLVAVIYKMVMVLHDVIVKSPFMKSSKRRSYAKNL